MRLKSIQMTNFFSHENSHIDFEQLHNISMVQGSIEGDPKRSNGSGKTTMIEALLFSLYEKTRLSESKNTTLDDPVRWNSNGKMSVELEFYLEDTLFKIVRTRDSIKQKGTVSFEVSKDGKWKSLSEEKKTNTNKEIINKIGIDYETFCASICFQQKEIDKFVNSTESERKGIIKNILQLDKYDIYTTLAKTKVSSIDSQIKILDSIISSVNINAVDIEAKKQQLSKNENVISILDQEKESLSSQTDRLRAKQVGFNEQIEKKLTLQKQIDDQNLSIERMTKQIQSSKKKVQDYTSVLSKKQADYDKSSKSLDLLKDQFTITKQEILKEGKAADKATRDSEKLLEENLIEYSKLEGELQNIDKCIEDVNKLEEASCPTCYGCINSDTKASATAYLKAHKDLVTVRYDSFKQKVEEARSLVELTKQKLEEAKNKLQDYGRREKEKLYLEQTISLLKEALNEANLVIKDQENIQAENLSLISSCTKEIDSLKEKIGEIVIDDKGFKELNDLIKDKNDKLEINKRMLIDSQISKGRLQNEIKQLEDNLEKVQLSKQEKEYHLKDRFHYDQLVKMFGKEIPTLIVENACFDLSEEANKILKATSSDMIQFVTQRQNKDGTPREVFEIEITRPGVAKPILMDSLSNGQKFRIVFAIRIALSRLLSRRRSSPPIEFLFYDECFASLDDQGIDDIIDIFRYLKNEFKHQLIITHGTNLKDRFNDAIIFIDQNKQGISKIKY